jgi:hypothetical protein
MVCGIDILRILLDFSQLSVAAADLKPSFGKGPLKSVVAKARSCALKALGCTCGSLLLQDWQTKRVEEESYGEVVLRGTRLRRSQAPRSQADARACISPAATR